MSYGIWDVGRKKWMPDPLLGHMSRRPESFKTRGEAERTADREWRKLNPDVEFEVRPLPSTEESRRTRKDDEQILNAAEKAGIRYANDQLGSDYFMDWVREQVAEAEQMRRNDPSSVMPTETKSQARKVAKNMLQQLEWDTKRELNVLDYVSAGDVRPEEVVKKFYEGFDWALRGDPAPGDQKVEDWLADEILALSGEAREGGALEAREAYGRRGRRSGGDVPRYKRDEDDWQRQRSEYQAKVEPLKAGLVRIVGGDELLRRGIQIPTNGVIVASLSDPRRQNEPVAHFRRYPGFGYGEDGGLGQTYFVDPAIVPAGKETREARRHHPGTDALRHERKMLRRVLIEHGRGYMDPKLLEQYIDRYIKLRIGHEELERRIKQGESINEIAQMPTETREARRGRMETSNPTTYEEAKITIASIQSEIDAAEMVLKTFPSLPNGLTPDDVRVTAEYRIAKARYQAAFARLRTANAWFVKTFKRNQSRTRGPSR